MRAWWFQGSDHPMELSDLPDPVADGDFVVVDVMAAGMCHSDLHIVDGPGMVWLDHVPTVLGHEIAGYVAAVGDRAGGFQVGDRVAIGPGPGRCGGWCPPDVRHRQRPEDTTISSAHVPGLTTYGGYAEKCLVHAAKLVRLPETVSFEAAAVATDALLTAYHALFAAGSLKVGETVAIVGLGGLGMNALRMAVLASANVIGVDVNIAAFDRAIALGAQCCVTSVSEIIGYRPDLIVDFAGVGDTTSSATETVRIGGRVVLVGLGSESLSLSTYRFVTGQVTLSASLGGDTDDLRGVFDMLASGKLAPVLEEIPFDNIALGLDKLRQGTALGRLFMRPHGSFDRG